MSIKLTLLTFFVVVASLFAKANTTPPGTGEESANKSDIIGGVHHSETKKPISSVTITAYHLTSKKEKVVLTDHHGNFSFDNLQPGSYKFVFAKDGYKKVTKDKVLVRLDEGFQMHVELTEHTSFDFLPGPFHFSDFE